MKDLTLIIVGKKNDIKDDKNVEFIYTTGENIKQLIKIASGKYIAFIREEDKISKDYLRIVLDKTKTEFDSCFVNYIIEYKYERNINLTLNEMELANNKPFWGDYYWAHIFNRKRLLEVIDIRNEYEFNKKMTEVFTVNTAIGTLIYFHNPRGKRLVRNFVYSDIKRNEYHKNIIYVENGCAGIFNGYVSWVKNLGRCFGNKYDITVLFDNIHPEIRKEFSKYCKCVRRENDVNYYCDRLLVTYATYYYPKNIVTLDQNYMFIHGNMSDYPNTRVFHEDLFSHYVAVSKVAAEKAKGYFPTDNIEHIINPIKIEKETAKPHLTLTSAFKYSDVKRPDRVEKIAKILDELEIPYTWNVFTDQRENTNHNGLIYRSRVANPVPYVKDSDYFVLLSDSEAMPYCVMEAISVNTKVVVTPLEAYEELGVVNGKNGFVIPFNYFEDKNKKKLVALVKKMYKEKDKKVKFKLKESLWKDYNKVFKE